MPKFATPILLVTPALGSKRGFMKLIVWLMGVSAFYAGSTFADCSGYSCTAVQVEALIKGKAGPLVQTTGNEKLLKCGDYYGQLSVRANDNYRQKESLLSVANEFGLTVDIHLHRDISPCAINRIIVYSSK